MEKYGFVPTSETYIDENQYLVKYKSIRIMSLELRKNQ